MLVKSLKFESSELGLLQNVPNQIFASSRTSLHENDKCLGQSTRILIITHGKSFFRRLFETFMWINWSSTFRRSDSLIIFLSLAMWTTFSYVFVIVGFKTAVKTLQFKSYRSISRHKIMKLSSRKDHDHIKLNKASPYYVLIEKIWEWWPITHNHLLTVKHSMLFVSIVSLCSRLNTLLH